MAPLFRVSQLTFSPAPLPDWKDCLYATEIGVWLALSPQGSAAADKVFRSTDGLTWTEEDLPAGANWTSLVWSADAALFAAFCNNNSGIAVATSPDGVTWTNRHAERASIASGVYGQGKFVAVGGQRQVIGPNVFGKANFALAGVGVSTRTVNVNLSVSTTLLVGIVGEVADVVTGVTFNGVALTLVQKVQNGGDRWIYVFKLVDPSTGGAFALTVTFSATNQGSAIYYNGYSDAGDVLQSTTDTGTGTAISTSLTTTYDECWLAQFSVNDVDGTGTSGTVGVVRQTTDGQGGTWADSNSTVLGIPQLTPPGLYSIDVNVAASNWAAITVAFRPQVTLGFTTSGDGITWTETESPNATLQGVCYSPELDLFVAVGARFPDGAAYSSPDGTNWTHHALPGTSSPDLSATGNCVVVWADDLGLFVAVLEDGSVVKSDDGATWSTMTLPVAANIPLVLGVTWAKRLGLLVFFTEADSPGYHPLLYSEDGVTVVAVPYISTEDTDGDWRTGVYSGIDDRMVVFPHFNDYALLVEFGPHITEVVPPVGNIVGGNTVNVIGTGFEDGMTILFDAEFARDVVVVSATLATCTVPTHLTAELVDVTVTNVDGRFDVGELLYEYNNGTDEATGEDLILPEIGWMGSGCAPGSVVPDHGTMLGGTPVTIYGRGFRAGSTVLFGGLPATSVFIDTTQPFPALVLAKSPEAWWRLEEDSAALVLLDETANSHDATLPDATGKTSVRGGLSYSPTKGIALTGGSKGFAFDGTEGTAALAAALTTLAGACTIEFLLRPVAGGPTYGTIIGGLVDVDGIYVFDFAGDIRVSYESAAHGYSDQTNSTPLVAGQLYHIALVCDGAGSGLWVIDGVADGAVANINTGGILDALFDTGGFPLECQLVDEIAVYDTNLSVPQLLVHATNLDAGYPALVLADGAIAYWRCEEDDSATLLEDTTGNGTDATQAAAGRTSVLGGLADAHTFATISPTIPLSGAYSIEFLFNPLDAGGVQALLTSLADLGFFINADRSLRAQVAHTVQSDAALAADAIAHVVFTASGALARWYINGVNHTSGAGTWDGTDDVTLAHMLADTTGNPVACNVLDELVVHSVELTPAEVLEHFEAARQWVSGTFATVITPAHQTGPVDVEIVSP